MITSTGIVYDVDYINITIAAKALEKGKVYKLTLPQKLVSDPTKIVYSILLISTVDKSEKISIIPSQTEQTSLSPISFTYTIPQQNLDEDEQMRVYCD